MTADHAARAVELADSLLDVAKAIRDVVAAFNDLPAETQAAVLAVGRPTVQRPRWDDDLAHAPDHPEIVTERGQERGKLPVEYLCDVCSTYVDSPSDVRHDRAVHGDAS